jgi:hypothetical protein
MRENGQNKGAFNNVHESSIGDTIFGIQFNALIHSTADWTAAEDTVHNFGGKKESWVLTPRLIMMHEGSRLSLGQSLLSLAWWKRKSDHNEALKNDPPPLIAPILFVDGHAPAL